ncbi:MAG: hypothetical protein LIP01_09155 [Tannerellaceae bacterium]|nr:hypothetical protein [Tannerellaceae bacterium]
MESRYGYAKISIFFLFLFISCSGPEHTDSQLSLKEIAIPDSVQFMHGDIICRLGNGYLSNYFKKNSTNEKIYSHVGLVEIEKDSVFIIHAEASELTGVGKVKREPLARFLKDIKTWGIYRIPVEAGVCQEIIFHALDYYKKETPFDLTFNNENDSEVYCTQLVANAINKAVYPPLVTPAFSWGNKLFYGVDDIYLNSGFQKIYSTHPEAK